MPHEFFDHTGDEISEADVLAVLRARCVPPKSNRPLDKQSQLPKTAGTISDPTRPTVWLPAFAQGREVERRPGCRIGGG